MSSSNSNLLMRARHRLFGAQSAVVRDSPILAAAASAGCTTQNTEDMNAAKWRIANFLNILEFAMAHLPSRRRSRPVSLATAHRTEENAGPPTVSDSEAREMYPTRFESTYANRRSAL
jgi:hypothetical protein